MAHNSTRSIKNVMLNLLSRSVFPEHRDIQKINIICRILDALSSKATISENIDRYVLHLGQVMRCGKQNQTLVIICMRKTWKHVSAL